MWRMTNISLEKFGSSWKKNRKIKDKEFDEMVEATA